MKNIWTTLLLLSATTVHAAPQRIFQDLKLPSQKMVEKQTFTDPAAAGTADIKSAFAGNTSGAAVTLTSFIAQPDLPRNLVITPGTSAGDVETCVVVVNGTSIKGRTISENFSFTADSLTAATGAKAFKTVTSVVFPAGCEASPYAATWSIGYGEKLGVKTCMDNAGDIVKSLLNGTKEATEPTMVVDNDEVEKNTADFNGTMNGSNDFILYFMQNFCP